MHVYLMELHIFSGEESRSRSSFKVKRHIRGHSVSQTHLVFSVHGVCTVTISLFCQEWDGLSLKMSGYFMLLYCLLISTILHV